MPQGLDEMIIVEEREDGRHQTRVRANRNTGSLHIPRIGERLFLPNHLDKTVKEEYIVQDVGYNCEFFSEDISEGYEMTQTYIYVIREKIKKDETTNQGTISNDICDELGYFPTLGPF